MVTGTRFGFYAASLLIFSDSEQIEKKVKQ